MNTNIKDKEVKLEGKLSKNIKNKDFNHDQIQEIRLGLKNGGDVSIYANSNFNHSQMR